MSELTALPGNGAAKPPPERRVRHGLIEDWRDAVGILFLLLVAAVFGALLARFLPGGEDAREIELEARVTALESRAQKPASELDAVNDRIAKLDKRLATAEAAVSAGRLASEAAAAGANAALGAPATDRNLIDDLSARLTALETKTPADIQSAKDGIASLTTGIADMSTRVDAFADRIAKLENSDLLVLARRASLATAIANLMRAAQGSAPFKTEYDVVAAIVPNDPVLAVIEPLAVKGLPTTGTLIATFGRAADAALDAETLAKGGGSMWSALWANFMATISARPLGETPVNSTAGRIARAETRMKAGDLAAAVRELNAIQGAARAPLAPWLAQASARVHLESALAKLNTQAVAALSAPASTEPVPQLPTP